MRIQTIKITILIVIIAGAAGFFAGMKYQESKRPAFRMQVGTGTNNRFGRGGFRPVAGEIINLDDTSVTVKLQDGSSKIVFVSDKTQINKAEKAVKNDIKKGDKVAVFGSENSDGSITAQNIQLNSQFEGREKT